MHIVSLWSVVIYTHLILLLSYSRFIFVDDAIFFKILVLPIWKFYNVLLPESHINLLHHVLKF